MLLTKSSYFIALVLMLSMFFMISIFFIVFLTDNSSDTEKESLAQEIELGRSLDGDRHPNIVNFLGCVSASGGKTCLFDRLIRVSWHDLMTSHVATLNCPISVDY